MTDAQKLAVADTINTIIRDVAELDGVAMDDSKALGVTVDELRVILERNLAAESQKLAVLRKARDLSDENMDAVQGYIKALDSGDIGYHAFCDRIIAIASPRFSVLEKALTDLLTRCDYEDSERGYISTATVRRIANAALEAAVPQTPTAEDLMANPQWVELFGDTHPSRLRLIAEDQAGRAAMALASPDLLEALEAAHSIICHLDEDIGHADIEDAYLLGKAAIAKALGEQA